MDDERPKPDEGDWVVCTTSTSAIVLLNEYRDWEEVSLDHDLGGDDTGFKVLDFIIEAKAWPRTLSIHTQNPPARERMLLAASHEAPEWVDIYVQTW